MNIICSPIAIIDEKRPEQGITDLKNAGFENVVLDALLCGTLKEVQSLNVLQDVVSICASRKINTPVAYAPFVPTDRSQSTLETDTQKEKIIPLIEQSIALAVQAGCSSIIICPRETNLSGEKEWKINQEYYHHFAQLARESNLMLLLKNQCRSMNGHLVRGLCSDAVTAAEWVDKLNAEVGEERFGFCMDTAVHNICGQNMQEFARIMSHRVKAVILRDCDGSTEDSLLPFTSVKGWQSQTDWRGLICGLREIGFDGELILDMRETVQSFSPLLRPQFIQMAKSVMEYFQWQIELESHLKQYPSVVLFGAGNMCRNYMKCYGEQYPPLFTCDNNSALWGTTFAGLTVKNPECLKEIPENCVVLICNIYYREIQKQLWDMGIQNRIEFFNDEYMPSYFYDRVERM